MATKAPLIKTLDMRVSAKMLQQLASGIYRTPAAAVKELVSNAFDADATKVDINIRLDDHKGAVSEITVEDNGTGMDFNEFEWFAKHIGTSMKRIEGDTTPKERPLIGKIGIGLLSVGNATDKFTVLSAKADQDHEMKAEVDLAPYYDVRKHIETLDELRIGNVSLYQLEKEKEPSFTRVEFGEVKDPFSRDLASKAQDEDREFEWSKASFADFVDWLDRSKVTRIEQLSGFSKFMFELGLLTPVRYLSTGPVKGYENSPVIQKLTRRLANYDFHVCVNDIEIFKPILFPHSSDQLRDRGLSYKLYDISIDTQIAPGRRLSAIGYYYHQVKRIVPWTLRGVMVRVNNVGVGTYENRFAKIYTQSPVVLHQLTGELYVDDGLDSALNIDRSSFFESDDAYQRLWVEIAARLSPEELPKQLAQDVRRKIPESSITRDIKRRLEVRGKTIREKKESSAKEIMADRLSTFLEKNGYPRVSPRALTIKVVPGSTPRASVQRTETGTTVHVILHRRLREPVRSTVVSFLVAIEIILGKYDIGETRQRLRSFVKLAS